MASNALSVAHSTLPSQANVTPLDRVRLAKLVRELAGHAPQPQIPHTLYARELYRLQGELVKLQHWVHKNGLKVAILFEGRDAAGKGGAIKPIVQRLNPRLYRIAALTSPSEREKRQWYFQRYVAHLPDGGEIVLFDRSWYNRAGVERVMGFCTDEEYFEFLQSVPEFERMLARSGIVLIKYWFSITFEEQLRRLRARANNPVKQWKLSPMDVQSLHRFDDYTRAKEIMLQHTHIPEAPWWVVDAVDKRKARLNCIRHLLEQVPYQELPRREVALPEELLAGGHAHPGGPAAMRVPEVY
jgi:polyphosphate kinase